MSSAEGKRNLGMGEGEEPGGGGIAEGRRPFQHQRGTRTKPQLKQFRFGRRQATTHKKVVN